VDPGLSLGNEHGMSLSRNQEGNLCLTLSDDLLAKLKLDFSFLESTATIQSHVEERLGHGFSFEFENDRAAIRFITQLRSGNVPDITEAHIKRLVPVDNHVLALGLELDAGHSEAASSKTAKLGGTVGLFAGLAWSHQHQKLSEGYGIETLKDTYTTEFNISAGLSSGAHQLGTESKIEMTHERATKFENGILVDCVLTDRVQSGNTEILKKVLESRSPNPDAALVEVIETLSNPQKTQTQLAHLIQNLQPQDEVEIQYYLRPEALLKLAAAQKGGITHLLQDHANYSITQINVFRSQSEIENKTLRLDGIKLDYTLKGSGRVRVANLELAA